MFQLLTLQNIAQLPKSGGGGKPHPRSKFSRKEDEQLTYLVESIGDDLDWKAIASKMPDRTPRQCKERWTNYLAPNLDKSPWKEEEDQLLIKKYEELGPRWRLIAKSFPNRTEISVKNRMKKNLRKQLKNQRFIERLAQSYALMQQKNMTFIQNNAQIQNSQNQIQNIQKPAEIQYTSPVSDYPLDDVFLNDFSQSNDDEILLDPEFSLM
ncbi:Myb-like DNA-binding domain containing protein [Trichomonas vaginalis G3]|uniref:Myb-like DNA-binding domain containing protein n=1 Tax=Trichomonas vaginalis (strain ATCC PRA-98 / G3) TaxID=412133 RepID=A2G1U5_TRIV3|nr:RNA polymerase II transcription regulator recruiting protein [Trichomonas vaginalis G3]EAX88873.1 Myb-like DNA-binding domain containing protein [Trichomonas vaginalis G3]KAI5495145.1 RNA polymerase II transcription regulator recruiting protein [Trichomonas vaginalis G3]|eukprot:XP_001301803.1 Myb-like DNA-binding domain containing protein [Trichomonas vaginalis G3]